MNIEIHRLLLFVCTLLSLPITIGAQPNDRPNDYLVPFLAASEIALAADSDKGMHKAWKCGQALVVSYAATEVIKSVFRETRPDGSDNRSFPSGHAALAFTAASVLDVSQPDTARLAYPCAAYIAYQRVETQKHYWTDVIVGAIIGNAIGREFAYSGRSQTPQLFVSFAF